MTENADTSELERELYEIAVAGVFYGLGALSETVLAHLQNSARNPVAVQQGRALVRLAGGQHEEAVRLLDEHGGEEPESRVLKALALRRAGRTTQSEQVLESLPDDLAPQIREMVEVIRAS